METLRLTEKDFIKESYHPREYDGKVDLSSFKGNLEIDGDLDYVHFNSLNIKGNILVKSGTGVVVREGVSVGGSIHITSCGINAKTGISAGKEISVGNGIRCSEGGITAGGSISAGLGCILAHGGSIKSGGGISANGVIRAKESITTDWNINAGQNISSDNDITAGGGITSGLGVFCKGVLKAGKNIFAGTYNRRTLTDIERTVTCSKLEGNLEYGILNLIKIPN